VRNNRCKERPECGFPAVEGFVKCKWHLEAQRTHQASDKAAKRHLTYVGGTMDLEHLIDGESDLTDVDERE